LPAWRATSQSKDARESIWTNRLQALPFPVAERFLFTEDWRSRVLLCTVRFSIREYVAADFDAIYAIDQACYPADIAYSRGELRWYLSLPGAECLVAEIRGSSDGGGGRKSNAKTSRKKIAGFIVTARQDVRAHIVTIDVLELHRRAGLGASLLRRTEASLRKRGTREVWLETATNNEAAIAFWNKHGYRTRGRIRNYYPGGLDAFSMSKPLTGSAAQEN